MTVEPTIYNEHIALNEKRKGS